VTNLDPFGWVWHRPANYKGTDPIVTYDKGVLNVQLGAFWVHDPTHDEMASLGFVKIPNTAELAMLRQIAPPKTTFPMMQVITDIMTERQRQTKLWGEQRHPDFPIVTKNEHAAEMQALMATAIGTVRDVFCAAVSASQLGERSWMEILLEEIFEAGAETKWPALRTELIQCAAVILNWVEDGDTRIECYTCYDVKSIECAAHVAGDGCDEDMRQPCPDCAIPK
jgi:hypothetical protein